MQSAGDSRSSATLVRESARRVRDRIRSPIKVGFSPLRPEDTEIPVIPFRKRSPQKDVAMQAESYSLHRNSGKSELSPGLGASLAADAGWVPVAPSARSPPQRTQSMSVIQGVALHENWEPAPSRPRPLHVAPAAARANASPLGPALDRAFGTPSTTMNMTSYSPSPAASSSTHAGTPKSKPPIAERQRLPQQQQYGQSIGSSSSSEATEATNASAASGHQQTLSRAIGPATPRDAGAGLSSASSSASSSSLDFDLEISASRVQSEEPSQRRQSSSGNMRSSHHLHSDHSYQAGDNRHLPAMADPDDEDNKDASMATNLSNTIASLLQSPPPSASKSSSHQQGSLGRMYDLETAHRKLSAAYARIGELEGLLRKAAEMEEGLRGKLQEIAKREDTRRQRVEAVKTRLQSASMREVIDMYESARLSTDQELRFLRDQVVASNVYEGLRTLLCVQRDDDIVPCIQKMVRIMEAVPRMDQWIRQICTLCGCAPDEALDVVSRWKDGRQREPATVSTAAAGPRPSAQDVQHFMQMIEAQNSTQLSQKLSELLVLLSAGSPESLTSAAAAAVAASPAVPSTASGGRIAAHRDRRS